MNSVRLLIAAMSGLCAAVIILATTCYFLNRQYDTEVERLTKDANAARDTAQQEAAALRSRAKGSDDEVSRLRIAFAEETASKVQLLQSNARLQDENKK